MKRAIALLLATLISSCAAQGRTIDYYRRFSAEQVEQMQREMVASLIADLQRSPGSALIVAVEPTGGFGWQVLSLHRRMVGNDWVYAMRLNQGWPDLPDPPRWADASSCPAVSEALKTVEQISAPRVNFRPRDPKEEERLMNTFDGTSYRLFAYGRTPYIRDAEGWLWEDVSGPVELKGANGSSLERWTKETLTALAPCWTSEGPPT